MARDRLSNRDLAIKLYREGIRQRLESDAVFRQFLWTLIVNSGMFAPSPRQGSHADASYMLGRHSLGAEVLNDLMAARSDALALLSAEADRVAIMRSDAEDQSAPPPGEDDEPENPADDFRP